MVNGVLKLEHRRLLIYSRLGALSYMYYYGASGIPYRDLKTALELSDSRLGPQLLWLRKRGYARVKVEKEDEVELSVYYIEPKGREAFEAVLSWIDSMPLGEIIRKKQMSR